MFKPESRQSESAKARMENAFRAAAGNAPDTDLRLVYGYYQRAGWIRQRVFRFVVGFSAPDGTLAILSLDTDGEPQTLTELNPGDIQSLRYSFRYRLTVHSPLLPKKTKMFIPPYIATTLESSGIPPLRQQENVRNLRAYVKAFTEKKHHEDKKSNR